MKILLIVPPFNFLKEGYGTKSKIKRGNLPNLGLCYIAACLEKAKHEVKIIDAQALNPSCEDVVKKALDFNPDLIGISVTNAHLKGAKQLVPMLKEKINVPIICGGPQITCFPKRILEEEIKLADVAVIGEGELTMVELAEAFEKGKDLSDIKGIAYRDKENNVQFTEKRPILVNLDELPIPAWHLLDLSLYSPLPDQYKRLPAISMVTSRGCTWRKCTFCFQASTTSNPYRCHSPKRVIEEIKLLQNKYGIKEIDFLDDEFFLNEKWVKEFCDLLEGEKIDLSWSAYGRVDKVTENMFRMAKKVGCWSVFFGFESGNQDLLDQLNKGITLDQIRNACKLAKKHGLNTRGAFMLGLPGETPEKAMNTINFAIELGLTTVSFHLLHPEYGTKIYDIAIKEGKLVDDWVKRTAPGYVPSGYKNEEEVKKMQKLAFRKFYFRPSYVFQRIRDIHSFNDLRRNFEGLRYLLGLS